MTNSDLEVIISDAVLCHFLAQGFLACVVISIPCQLHIGVLQSSGGEVWWGVIGRDLLCGIAYLPPSKALQQT